MRFRYSAGCPPVQVYHAEECRLLRGVLRVDDETHQYCQGPFRMFEGEVFGIVHQARRIVILLEQLLVVINPIEDEAAASIEAMAKVAA